MQKKPIIPIPARDLLVALYEGIHPDTDGKPLSLTKIAAYFAKKYKRSVSVQTVSKWFKHYKIKIRDPTIPMPPRDLLVTLYEGTHPDTDGKPLTLEEIATYITQKYNRSVSYQTTRKWFKHYKIKIRDPTIPMPPRDLLVTLYEGTHPDTNGKSLTLEEIATYFAQKYNRSVRYTTVSKWFKLYKIKTRGQTITMPPRNLLVTLYEGTHPDTNGKPLTLEEIAAYFTRASKQPVHSRMVSNWFSYYKIKAKDTSVIPIPPKALLAALYKGTHPNTNGKPFSQAEIAAYFTLKNNRPVSVPTVSKWFRYYMIEARVSSFPDDWKFWEEILYVIAEILLSGINWQNGHGKRILTSGFPKNEYIEPEIIITWPRKRHTNKFKKFIDAKRSNSANIKIQKSTHILPKSLNSGFCLVIHMLKFIIQIKLSINP
ncbi:MAG: hypothetical protein ACFFC7_23350 [Candidatus Hermodarchaeota archaeon]